MTSRLRRMYRLKTVQSGVGNPHLIYVSYLFLPAINSLYKLSRHYHHYTRTNARGSEDHLTSGCESRAFRRTRNCVCGWYKQYLPGRLKPDVVQLALQCCEHMVQQQIMSTVMRSNAHALPCLFTLLLPPPSPSPPLRPPPLTSTSTGTAATTTTNNNNEKVLFCRDIVFAAY